MFSEIGQRGAGKKGADLSVHRSILQTDTFDRRSISAGFGVVFS
jgi:hypothetical protein